MTSSSSRRPSTPGEFFGLAHSETAGARIALDVWLDKSVADALRIGAYAQAGCEDAASVIRAKLREAIFLLSAIAKSMPVDSVKGLDARRQAGDGEEIPDFRTLICDLLEVPNPHVKPEQVLAPIPENARTDPT